MPSDPKPPARAREPKPLTRRTPLKARAPLKTKPLKAKPYDRRRGARSGEVVECARVGCQRTFYAKPSDVGKRKYCSRACSVPDLAERSRETRLGRRNPNYKNGRRAGLDVSRAFNLRLKGEDRCRNCRSRDRLALHHAIPRGLGTPESKINLLNGLPLCGSCHAGWHAGWLVVTRDVFRADEWAYLLSVEMTGRVTAAWLDDRYPAEPRVPTCRRGHVLEGRNVAPNGAGSRTCRRCRMDRLSAARGTV